MSATIGINKSKFVIFGAGHDYTLADSGNGEKMIFSHPFVPLNSVNYAGQYYFLVADENGNMMDAVKDDIAHCTFTPALGTAFDTEGEVTVKVEYYREYVYPESTLVVRKTVEQTIEVVNHGTVANTYPNLDVYSDGYGFIRPNNVNTVEVKKYALSSNNMTKCSSIPWRATALGNGIYQFVSAPYLTDISELEYADVSNCTELSNLFYNCQGLTDISALAKWDVSKVQTMYYLFSFTRITSLESLKDWNTSSLRSLDSAFVSIYGTLTNLKGLENWDVSKVTNLKSAFASIGDPQVGYSLRDLTALQDWDVSNVTNLQNTFSANKNLESFEGLENWDVSKVTNMQATFSQCEKIKSLLPLSNWTPKPTILMGAFWGCYSLKSTKGLDNFDTSNCTNMRETFNDCPKLLKLEGLETWNTSKVQTFNGMFSWDRWIESFYPLKDWSFESCTDASGMFSQNANVDDLNGIIWDLSHVPSISGMFMGYNMCWAEDLGKKLVEYDYRYEDYEGNTYWKTGYGPYPIVGKDASYAENWTVNGTGLNAFDSTWSNRPSWN